MRFLLIFDYTEGVKSDRVLVHLSLPSRSLMAFKVSNRINIIRSYTKNNKMRSRLYSFKLNIHHVKYSHIL